MLYKCNYGQRHDKIMIFSKIKWGGIKKKGTIPFYLPSYDLANDAP